MANAPPVKRFKMQGVEVAVWAKHTEEKGTRYSITTQKSYFDKNTEAYVNSGILFPNEAAILIPLMNAALVWIAEEKSGRTFTESVSPNVEKPF